jgi:hypothetical protein
MGFADIGGPMTMSWRDAAWRIACEFDRADISDEELDWILWEYTAFPVAPWTHVAARLREHFAGVML